MVTLADLSQRGQWTEAEVNAAAAKAAAMSNNDSDKALQTFIGETKRAMHPSVRSHVPALVSLRDLVWNAETEHKKADKNAPTPCRKAFARAYHMLIQMFGETQSGRILSTHADVLAWAEEHDPDLDLDKVLKRLQGIRDQLTRFYTDWPVDDIQVCIDALNEVDKKTLRNARAGNVVEIPAKNITKTDTAPEEEPAHDVAAGASDILDDVLGLGAAA